MQMALSFYSSMAHAFLLFTHVMMSNDLFALLCIILFYFLLTLFKLGCLSWSVWEVTFNDETFFFF